MPSHISCDKGTPGQSRGRKATGPCFSALLSWRRREGSKIAELPNLGWLGVCPLAARALIKQLLVNRLDIGGVMPDDAPGKGAQAQGQPRSIEARLTELENHIKALTGVEIGSAKAIQCFECSCGPCNECASCRICRVCRSCNVCQVCRICNVCFECSCGPCAG